MEKPVPGKLENITITGVTAVDAEVASSITGLAGALHAMMTGIAPLSSIEYHASESILIMTIIGGTGNLFASVLGAAFYILFGDWLSSLWPRWLMLLGILLIAVSLAMQKGLWGLGQQIVRRLRPMGSAVPPVLSDDGKQP